MCLGLLVLSATRSAIVWISSTLATLFSNTPGLTSIFKVLPVSASNSNLPRTGSVFHSSSRATIDTVLDTANVLIASLSSAATVKAVILSSASACIASIRASDSAVTLAVASAATLAIRAFSSSLVIVTCSSVATVTL